MCRKLQIVFRRAMGTHIGMFSECHIIWGSAFYPIVAKTFFLRRQSMVKASLKLCSKRWISMLKETRQPFVENLDNRLGIGEYKVNSNSI